jgi:hypothetical protein
MDHHVQADGLSAPVVDSLLYQAEHDYAVADESTKLLFFAFTQKMELYHKAFSPAIVIHFSQG